MKSIFPFDLEKPFDIHRIKKNRKTKGGEGTKKKRKNEEKCKIGPFDQ